MTRNLLVSSIWFYNRFLGNMTSSVYQPLHGGDNPIRLLVLESATQLSAPIKCGLVYTRLPLDPLYEALSYTWGTQSPSQCIYLNGNPFEVTESLEAALRRLRYPSRERTLWVDAICINQNDPEELGKQVQQMRRIYEQAENVVVWLGEPGNGERVAMKSFCRFLQLSVIFSQQEWPVKKNMDLPLSAADLMTGNRHLGSWDIRIGEVCQLLDRPWWRRLWIVQEITVARNVTVVCGPDQASWDSITQSLRPNKTYKNFIKRLPLQVVDGVVVESPASIPDTQLSILDHVRANWRASPTWNYSLYGLLFNFRHFGCADPRDRIYAFLGLATDIQEVSLIPDYLSSAANVYTNVARILIHVHKHLLILNCKREVTHNPISWQQLQIYSTPDRAKFFDPAAPVSDGPNKKPGRGWVRLPDGWERQITERGSYFYNHNTKTACAFSPLADQAPVPPQPVDLHRTLPCGWSKSWDNLGRTKFTYSPASSVEEAQKMDSDLMDLPSWVPNWAGWSSQDPEPFPDLTANEQRYWASGEKNCASGILFPGTDLRVLTVRGIVFDHIQVLEAPWCPEPHLLPISRRGVKILESWEKLALEPVGNCPYTDHGGREDAFWRTHLADYAGDGRLPPKDKDYFESWCDRPAWTPNVSRASQEGSRSPRQKANMRSLASLAMSSMAAKFIKREQARDLGRKSALAVWTTWKYFRQVQENYKKFRRRIYRVSANRALFITRKGYMGLAPWNAKVGDKICILLGGCTPFLLRERGQDDEQYTLVGEAYVHGIMGGEVFRPELGPKEVQVLNIA
jgi:Heterokaryon incompatibility protein (HET)